MTKVADEIITTGRATHAQIGIRPWTVTSELQRQYKLARSSGGLVYQAIAGGPAAKAGIQQGDIIIKVDDREMVAASELLIAVRDRKPGDKEDVTLDRNGQEMIISVILEERLPDR